MLTETYRGSRKHVLDWTGQATFPMELLAMIGPTGPTVAGLRSWMPAGRNTPDEARLETYGPRVMPGHSAWKTLRPWWLAHPYRANTPNWDIAAACNIDGRPGLLLVEAKANKSELKTDGKPISSKASERSRQNHEHIWEAINEVCQALGNLFPGVWISRDSHYQLSNRVAFTWKLASLGLPTVLVYLGFLGDHGVADAGRPFIDNADWQTTFAKHLEGVLPAEFLERRIDCGAASMWMLVRSRTITSASPPPPSSEGTA